ncbi:MAG TPA: hypothetical protein VJQ83_02810 [Tepidiformaceae bacterium]|nr:hypothetical protein [Tepidiformaceae bacterium]
MSGFDRPWALAGGWAADAWLGQQTREHGDVDIVVFDQDQRALFGHLAGWNMVAHDPPIAGGGSNTDRWDGHRLRLPAHIHARPPGSEIPQGWPVSGAPQDGLNLEVILDRRQGSDWWLQDDRRMAVVMREAIQQSPGGVPTLAPRLVMFFKATAYPEDARFPRPQDEADFVALRHLLDNAGRTWLRDAIASARPDHPWLSVLAE